MRKKHNADMGRLAFVVYLGIWLIACNQKNNLAVDSESDPNATRDGGSGTEIETNECGGDPTKSNIDICAKICNVNTTQEECESTILPSFDMGSMGHGCLWYTGTEVEMGDAGVCTFGNEKRSACGYAAWGEYCGASGLWCEGQETSSDVISAGYILENESIFLFKDVCGPVAAGKVQPCAWESPVLGEWYLKNGVEECACACSEELEVNTRM